MRHKFIIKVFLSKLFYTQAFGDLGQLSGGPTTHHPAQQLRGPLAHGGFYGVEGHFKPELDRTLNNELGQGFLIMVKYVILFKV